MSPSASRLTSTLCLLLAACRAPAPPPPTAPAGDEALPREEELTEKTLASGMRVWLRPQKTGLDRIELRLVVDVGARLESDDEGGYAHFIEHMAFGGSRLFGERGLYHGSQLHARAGYGADTDFDQTVYQLNVPASDAPVLEKGLRFLRELVGDMGFAPDRVERQRSIIRGEHRTRAAEQRDTWELRDRLWAGSIYGRNWPIGTAATVAAATPERLRAFYQRWYRPQLMLLVATGDFETTALAERVQRLFGDLPRHPEGRATPATPIPPRTRPDVAVLQRREYTREEVMVEFRVPRFSRRTEGDLRRALARQLYHQMMDERLEARREGPDTACLGVNSQVEEDVVRPLELHRFSCRTSLGGLSRGLAAVLEEQERARRFGFTKEELERARLRVGARRRRSSEEEDRQVTGLADRLAQQWLRGDVPLGAPAQWKIEERLLSDITEPQVEAEMQKALQGLAPLAVLRATPATTPPTEAQGLALVGAAPSRPLSPRPAADSGPAPALPVPPVEGKIVAERYLEGIDTHEWVLENGARVVVKKTDFHRGEILFRATSPGGYSLASDAERVHAYYADAVAQKGGVGPLTAAGLRRMLSGKKIELSPAINRLTDELNGKASPEHLELLVQLAWLTMRGPRRDEAAFRAYKAGLIETARLAANDPREHFLSRVRAARQGNHPRSGPPSVSEVERLDLDSSLAAFRERFANAGDFTFFFVGDVTLGQLRPLVHRYLASLPGDDRRQRWRDEGIRPLRRRQELRLRAGTLPGSFVSLSWVAEHPYSAVERVRLRLVGEVLDKRVTARLREELGGTYDPQTKNTWLRWPISTSTVEVRFTAAPERTSELVTALEDEVRQLASAELEELELASLRKGLRRRAEQDLRDDQHWLDSLNDELQTLDGRPDQIPQEPTIVEAQSTRDVQEAIRRYLDPRRLLIAVHSPRPPRS